MRARCAALCLLLFACAEEEQPTLTREQLMNPETCWGCHPAHYREWKASMHAYAADDPVFRAMNELGQRDTDGGLGDFCVRCHAPMAVKEKATKDGRNLDDVPQHLKGVTCYFCHNAVSVTGDHNAEIELANDTTMRGALDSPVRPSAHGVADSDFMDQESPESARMCGACHDLVNDNGVHLERTFAEFNASRFSQLDRPGFLSCSSTCHMRERLDLAANDPESGVASRLVSSHLWPGVDVALTEWPDRQEYERVVNECGLANSVTLRMEQNRDGNIDVWLENTGAGHNVPSGASQDRRMWIEFVAFDEFNQIVCADGLVPDDEAVVGFTHPQHNPCNEAPTVYRDVIFDEDGEETHMFWRAAPSEAYDAGVSGRSLRPTPRDLGDHADKVTFLIPMFPQPTRITARVRMRAMDHDVLDELIAEGLLDESIPAEIPTFTILGTERALKLVDGVFEPEEPPDRTDDCVEAMCAFTPDSLSCQ